MDLSAAGNVAPDAPRPLVGFWSSYVRLLREKPVEALSLAGLILTGSLTALHGLGLLTMRAREALLALDPLKYSNEELLLTGLDTLWSLPWRGLVPLFSSDSVLRVSAWTLLGMLLALIAVRRLARRWAPILPAFLLMIVPLLVLGAALYTVAVRASNLDAEQPGVGVLCGGQLSSVLTDRIAFETCSWLTNDKPANSEHRQSLGGLLSWMLAVSLAAAWAGAAWTSASRTGRILQRVLIVLYLLLSVFLLQRLPLAHSYSEWGLLYRPVQVSDTCDGVLSQAIAAETCCAFDVSAGAEQTTLLLRGSGCPRGTGAMILSAGGSNGRECVTHRPRKAVVFEGCR